MNLQISEEMIQSFAQGTSAMASGKKLASGNKYQKLWISADNSLLFGVCSGSNNSSYNCSVDLLDVSKPIGRCSCPSRQHPCKHAVGLLYAVIVGLSFEVAEIPDDIAEKRQKLQRRRVGAAKAVAQTSIGGADIPIRPVSNDPATATNRAITSDAASAPATAATAATPPTSATPNTAATPATPNTAATPDATLIPVPTEFGVPTSAAKARAMLKRCETQITGINLAEKLLLGVVNSGFAGISGDYFNQLVQQAKELGNYHVSGIQAKMAELLYAIRDSRASQDYSQVQNQAIELFALLKKAREYTQIKASDARAYPQTPNNAREGRMNSDIEERLGTAWRLTDLQSMGMYRTDDELLQLSFICRADNARMQWVDEGIWISLSNGEIFYTRNYRPFRVARRLEAQDSQFGVVCPAELYIYPGTINSRVRWDQATVRKTTGNDILRAMSFAHDDYQLLIRTVVNQGISPLGNRSPLFLIRLEQLKLSEDGRIAAIDGRRNSILLERGNAAYQSPQQMSQQQKSPQQMSQQQKNPQQMNPQQMSQQQKSPQQKSPGYMSETSLLKNLAKEQLQGKVMLCRFGNDVKSGILFAQPLTLLTGTSIIRLQIAGED
jgi:hypothetical protein